MSQRFKIGSPDEKETAILASFVWCPMGRACHGRTGSNVAQVSKSVFYSLFGYGWKRDNFPWQGRVTISCKSLVRRGYLQQVGIHKWEFQGREGWSPLFNLTESGLLWILSQLDDRKLCQVQDAFTIYHKKRKHRETNIQEQDRRFSAYADIRGV